MVSPLSNLAVRASSRSLARQWLRIRLPTPRRAWLSTEASAAPGAPKDIAVIGAGLTGLTTAYYLTRFHPTAKITVYESTERSGGWLDSRPYKCKDGEVIYMEAGARMLAPQLGSPKWEDFVFYELMHELQFNNEVSSVPKNHPTFSKRYIYYPDHLVELPNKVSSLWDKLRLLYSSLTEPIYQGAISAAVTFTKKQQLKAQTDFFRSEGQRPQEYAIADLDDISAGEFLQDRTGQTKPIDNIVSAVMHGIWGGDIWKLSALEGTLQDFYVAANVPLHTSRMPESKLVKHSNYFSGSDILMRTPEVADLVEQYSDASYLGFREGFDVLSREVFVACAESPNVTFKMGTPVEHIRYDKETQQALITTSTANAQAYDKVVSSLDGGTLAKLTGDALPALEESKAVTIQIVNLYYEDVQLESIYPGFGYLIPQSVPAENNPFAALGVIFDSNRDAAAGLQDRPKGTNLTVMLGGHYWDSVDPSSWPDAETAAQMARKTVEHQLGIPSDSHVSWRTKRCRNCISQHLVGHRELMARTHKQLMESFQGTLAVVGGSYTMPGILPSLQAARDMALTVSGRGYLVHPDLRGNTTEYDMRHVGKTGLGRFVGRNETFQLLDSWKVPFRPLKDSPCPETFNNPEFQL